MKTVRELMEELRKLKEWDYCKKEKILKKLNVIVKTLKREKPILMVHTLRKMYSGWLIDLKLIGNEMIKFAIATKNPNMTKDKIIWEGETKIPNELEDIFLWQNKKGEPLFWNNLFKEEEFNSLNQKEPF